MFGPTLAFGDGTADSAAAPPVEEFVALAIERSPVLAAGRSKAAATNEMVSPAGALADPMLEFGVTRGFGEMPSTQYSAELSQELPFPGKRGALRSAAGAAADAEELRLGALELDVVKKVRVAYARLYAMDRELATLDAAQELLEVTKAAVGARYAAGGADQEALIKAQLAASRLADRRETLVAERLAMAAELNALVDAPGDAPIGAVDSLPEVSAPELPAQDGDLSTLPSVAAGRAAAEAAEHRLDAADREVYPDFLVGVGAATDAAGEPMGMLRFGITLPFWQASKQRPMIRAAQHELDMARAEVREAQAMGRSDAARLAAAWERDTRRIRLFQEAIVPQTRAALDAARASYLVGAGDFSMLIEDFNMWLDARVELAERKADRYITWAEAQALGPAAVAENAGGTP